jgi:hypothetical protein
MHILGWALFLTLVSFLLGALATWVVISKCFEQVNFWLALFRSSSMTARFRIKTALVAAELIIDGDDDEKMIDTKG